MAKLSALSRRLRRSFQLEHPQAAQLDDALLEYFSRMLEDDEASEDELVESWVPLVLDSVAFDDESSTSEMCRAVLKRLRSIGNLTSASSSSDSESRVGLPLGDTTQGSLARTPSTSSAVREPKKAEVRGLEEWLERLSLRHYASSARSWCIGMGAAHVDEIIESWEEFCDDLRLKTLERRRVYKDCVGRSATRSESRETGAVHQDFSVPQSPCLQGAGTCQATSRSHEIQQSVGTSSPETHSACSAAGGGQCELGSSHNNRQRPMALTPLLSRTQHCEAFGPPGGQYTILSEIGSGATATVYKCTRDDEVYAAKTVCKSKFRMQRDFAGMMDRLHRETAILFSLRHSHIVSLYDVIDTDDKLYLVMEYVEGGELFNEIVSNGALAEQEARYVFLQIVLGLRYIHSKGVVHRDLKPENVLVDKNSSRPGLLEVKISDFGHSKLVNDGYSTALSQVGTPQFWAPEVADSCDTGYDERADLWSLGVVLYLMLVGSYPFADAKAPVEPTFGPRAGLSQGARDLVLGLLQLRPHDRLPLDRCLRHPWVMSASGPLSRMVELCERREWSRHRQCERCVQLPRDPRDVKQLRRDLQDIIFKFKLPVLLRHHEVSVRFAADEIESEAEEVAWEELMQILEWHYPDGSFLRPDRHSLPVIPLDMRLDPVTEEDALVRGESSMSISSARPDEELRRHDALIKVAVEAFPDAVEATVDHQAVRHVDLRLRLGPWRTLELTIGLPPGFPEVCSMQLESIALRCPRKQLGGIEGRLRERISSHLDGPPPVPGLLELLSWLHEEVLPDLTRAVSGGAVAGEPEADAGDAAANEDPLEPVAPACPVKCGRLVILTYQHDAKIDKAGMSSDKMRGYSKNQSFFWHIKHQFPEVSGVMSYGKPAVLLAEGPLTVVEKLRSEVGKFTPWWPVQEKVFHVSEPVLDVNTWRAFGNFSKVRTEEVRQVCEKAGQSKLYELLAAGTSLDPNRRKSRHR